MVWKKLLLPCGKKSLLIIEDYLYTQKSTLVNPFYSLKYDVWDSPSAFETAGPLAILSVSRTEWKADWKAAIRSFKALACRESPGVPCEMYKVQEHYKSNSFLARSTTNDSKNKAHEGF